MTPLPFERTPTWARVLRGGSLGASVLFHLALALFALQERPKDETRESWMEMMVVQKPPPPPPPPPPPAPEPPKPKPKAVEFKDTVKQPTPTPEAPPPEARRVVKMQGLSSSSFAPGSGTGLSVRAGTTVATAATSETMSIDEASKAIPYSAATSQPVLRFRPPLEVPDELKANGVEGSVEVVLDIDADGKVSRVTLAKGLGYGADEACIKAWQTAKFKPAKQGDTPVPVTNMPQRCTFKAIE